MKNAIKREFRQKSKNQNYIRIINTFHTFFTYGSI